MAQKHIIGFLLKDTVTGLMGEVRHDMLYNVTQRSTTRLHCWSHLDSFLDILPEMFNQMT